MSNKSPKTTSLDFQVGEMVDKIMPLLYSYERRYETISAINKVLGDSITLQVLDDKNLLKAELVSAISKKYQNDKEKGEDGKYKELKDCKNFYNRCFYSYGTFSQNRHTESSLNKKSS